MPEVIREVKGDDIYPAEAKRMGIEGVVRLKIGIDEKGNVVEVRSSKPGRARLRRGRGQGHAAVQVLARAIANDGRPFRFRIV